jgi:predicted RNA-binding Zn ribbon-like protein
LLIAFANSVDVEEGTDDLTTPQELTEWLVSRGLLAGRARSTAEELALARRLRDGVHAALVANHDAALAGGDDGRVDSTALDTVAAELPLIVSGIADRGPGLRPLRDGVHGALSQILVAVNGAVVDGSWGRVKICASDECRWAYFDTTKNHSRAYCEWGCGNKLKTRAYRARKKAAAAATAGVGQ